MLVLVLYDVSYYCPFYGICPNFQDASEDDDVEYTLDTSGGYKYWLRTLIRPIKTFFAYPIRL